MHPTSHIGPIKTQGFQFCVGCRDRVSRSKILIFWFMCSMKLMARRILEAARTQREIGTHTQATTIPVMHLGPGNNNQLWAFASSFKSRTPPPNQVRVSCLCSSHFPFSYLNYKFIQKQNIPFDSIGLDMYQHSFYNIRQYNNHTPFILIVIPISVFIPLFSY